MCRRVRIICACRHQETLYRIRMNMFNDLQESLPLIHPDFRKSLLPNRSAEPKFPPGPKRKTASHKLHRLLHGHLRAHRDQHMEVIRHDYKFVEKIFPLLAIMIEHVNHQPGRASGLQKSAFLPSRGSHEEGTLAGDDV